MQYTLHREEFLFGAPNAREALSRSNNIQAATSIVGMFFATDSYYKPPEELAIYLPQLGHCIF